MIVTHIFDNGDAWGFRCMSLSCHRWSNHLNSCTKGSSNSIGRVRRIALINFMFREKVFVFSSTIMIILADLAVSDQHGFPSKFRLSRQYWWSVMLQMSLVTHALPVTNAACLQQGKSPEGARSPASYGNGLEDPRKLSLNQITSLHQCIVAIKS